MNDFRENLTDLPKDFRKTLTWLISSFQAMLPSTLVTTQFGRTYLEVRTLFRQLYLWGKPRIGDDRSYDIKEEHFGQMATFIWQFTSQKVNTERKNATIIHFADCEKYQKK